MKNALIGKRVLYKGSYWIVEDIEGVYATLIPVVSDNTRALQPHIKDPAGAVRVPIDEIVAVLVEVYSFVKGNLPWFKKIWLTVKSWFKKPEK